MPYTGVIPGCTDPTACNYNDKAEVDNGSCCYTSGCNNPLGTNYNAGDCCSDACTFPIMPAQGYAVCDQLDTWIINDIQGFSTPAATNPLTGVWQGGSITFRITNPLTSPPYTQPDPPYNNCTVEEVFSEMRWSVRLWEVTGAGSTTSTGNYYNETYNYEIAPFASQTVAISNIPPGNYRAEVRCTHTNQNTTNGCAAVTGTDSFWGKCYETPVAVTENQTPGCIDPAASNYNILATENDGSCTYPPVYGCTDPLALNYNTLATINETSATDSSNPCRYPVPGCTDPTAINFNPLATVDDGSCIYCVYGCMDSTASNYNPLATCDNGGCIPCVYGCTNPSSSNYNPLATCDDGSCTGCVYGCTDSTSSNYSASATCDDGSCCVDGCTDPTATNYNVLATCDDGSCTPCVDGCTDPTSSNYNSLATCDDGTCLEGECSDCFKLLNVLYKEANCEGCTEDDYITEERNLQRFTNLRIMRDLAYECADNDYIDIMKAEEYELCSTLLDEHTNEGVNDYKVYGCTNPSSLNYNPNATHPCIKNGVLNYCCGDTDADKNTGCTDPLATNYNPVANIDDGSCLYATPVVPAP